MNNKFCLNSSRQIWESLFLLDWGRGNRDDGFYTFFVSSGYHSIQKISIFPRFFRVFEIQFTLFLLLHFLSSYFLGTYNRTLVIV